MALSHYIELYRLSGKPDLNDDNFAGKIPFNQQSRSLLVEVTSGIEEVIVDDQVSDLHDLPESGESIEFVCTLPRTSSAQFYPSLERFLHISNGLSKGDMPEEFYIVDLDYYSGDETEEPENLKKIRSICKLISDLSELAQYHDRKDDSKHLRLVFFHQEKESVSSPTVIETLVLPDMVKLDFVDLTLIQGLVAEDANKHHHYNAEIGIFRATITEIVANISEPRKAFAHLIKHWSDFSLLYQNNLATYMSGFAFHKAKMELANTELKLAEEFSKVIGEITGKLLGIPLSLAAVLGIYKTTSEGEAMVLLGALVLAAILIWLTVTNQKKQLKRISNAKELQFNALEGEIDNFPDELVNKIANVKGEINNNETFLRGCLYCFQSACVIPVIYGVWVFFEKHHPILHNKLLCMLSFYGC